MLTVTIESMVTQNLRAWITVGSKLLIERISLLKVNEHVFALIGLTAEERYGLYQTSKFLGNRLM